MVDDITDLCRFDQGRVLLVEKEAVKMRDICNEALKDVSGGMMASMVDVVLDVREGSPGRVVTEIEPAGPFWEAEPEHQDYLERIPNGYTCHFIRPNWKLPKRG